MTQDTARTTLLEELVEASTPEEILLAESKIAVAERHQ